MRPAAVRALGLILLALASGGASAATVETDVCIYGGTSGGIIAAVELTRLGKRVELLAPGTHLGGMTTGGLSNTDVGTVASIGGLSREFYQRVGAQYSCPEVFSFEPRVASSVFATMLVEAGITPRLNQKLSAVTKQGAKIVELRTAQGLRVQASVFIDATYEGDLMAKAGVAYTVGREGRATYGETLAGVSVQDGAHQFQFPVDPYRRRGSARTGFLPGVGGPDFAASGAGDNAVQAYNYRMCLTNVPSRRRPIARPSGYREEDYGLVARQIAGEVAAGQKPKLSDYLVFAPLPNGKFDVNSNGPISTDCVGLSADYPDGTFAKRAVIATRHRRWVQGLLYFLGHSESVPATLRWEMLQYGLCADEFRSTAGWPPQLYVREARRMLGAYVMQQGNCLGTRRVADSVALGSYAVDSHVCRRVVQNNVLKNDGVFFVRPQEPYRISYRALTPQADQCSNLLVTFAVSASHVAFGSLRMEPVFMMLSQSAANAASLAIDAGVSVQAVDYKQLAAQLTERGQILKWPVPPEGTIVVDNADASCVASGPWTRSDSMPGFYGDDYAVTRQEGVGDHTFRFVPEIAEAGEYDILLRWSEAPNRAKAVPVEILAADGPHTVFVDQTRNGSRWVKLGRWTFPAGNSAAVTIHTGGTSGYVVADSVVWASPLRTITPVGTEPPVGD